jgi:oligopeptide transport system substrate-binding protein
MRSVAQRWFIDTLIGVLALGWLGCRAHQSANLFPPNAAVLRVALADDVPTLDPAAGYDTASWEFEQVLFDTLLRYASDSNELRPDLALSWEVSPEAKNFTFHMRRDAHFTNGRLVTSADLRYSIERVINPKTRSQGVQYFLPLLGAADFAAGRAEHVRGIETPDPYTIIFRLDKPDPIFLHKLAMPFASAVPKEVVERWGDDFARHPIGTGPFMLREWLSGQQLVLEKNPHYFIPDRPKLDAIVALIGVNEELQWLKFEAGEIDISSIPPAEFTYVMKTPRLKALTIHHVSATTSYLGMNCQMAPFNDVRVRQAFNYAVNKQKLVAILNGRGVVARGVLPPGMPGYDPDIRGYPYDPAKARRLLEEAGVRRGFAPVVWLTADPTMLILGQSIQQDLALVGVNLVLKPVAWGPLLDAVREPRTAELFLLGWGADFPDPQNFLDVLFSKDQWGANNDTFYYDAEVQKLLAQAAVVADLTRRYALYQQIQQLIVRDAPWVFLYHPVAYVIRQPWVHGIELHPLRPARLDRIYLTPPPQRHGPTLSAADNVR